MSFIRCDRHPPGVCNGTRAGYLSVEARPRDCRPDTMTNNDGAGAGQVLLRVTLFLRQTRVRFTPTNCYVATTLLLDARGGKLYGATSDGRFTRKLGRLAIILRRNGPTFNSVTVNQSGPRASWLSVPTSTGREADSAPRTYRYTRRPHTEREGITATTQDLPVGFALTLKALAARSSAASGNK